MSTLNFNPIRIFTNLFKHRYLIWQLVRRDVLLKYKGSYLGIGWSFLYPLLLLTAFTIVFSGVFGGRWKGGSTGMQGLEYTLFIYSGLIIFTSFSEVITNAPRLLLANQNFIKKIIFPTEILPLVSMLSASVHGMVNLIILFLVAFFSGHAHASCLLVPIALLPVWLFTLGLAWLLTASGAYIRDLAHGMPVLMQMLMFMLPVFYPLSATPAFLHTLNSFNPLALAIEDIRRTLLSGQLPNWSSWLAMLFIGLFLKVLGYGFFTYCKEEFADVI
jgi:lipopolysaccharide transport system permease protein